MGSEHAVDMPMTPLAEQVQIQIADLGGKLVGIDLAVFAAGFIAPTDFGVRGEGAGVGHEKSRVADTARLDA